MSSNLRHVTGAGRAERGGRVEIQASGFDLLFTPQADPVCAGLQPPECRVDPGDLCRAPLFGRARHGLGLNRVHTRKPANALLIERNRFSAVRGPFAEFGQLVPQSAQARLDIAVSGHISGKPSQSDSPGRSPGQGRP